MRHSYLPKLLTLAVAASLTGCAGTMRSYDSELKGALQHTQQGNVDQALAALEGNNTGEDKDLLYFMEKGSLTRLKSDYPNSRSALLKANEKIQIWEDEVKTDPDKLMGLVGSVIVNDKVTRYDGQDFEKVMATTLLVMDDLALNELDSARVGIKKTHEREAVIQEYRDKEYAKVEEEAKSKNATTTFKELKGYPVETLDDPEVVGLKNGYQNAFSHYLAGFVYESLNEPSMAAPGYRKAIELRPGLPMLEDGLANLDGRKSKPAGQTDVLFVLESGSIAGRESVTIPLPIPTGGGLVVAPISFPVIRSTPTGPSSASVRAGNISLPLTTVVSLDAMARRCLRDDMPGIILRSTIRATLKGTLQNEMNKRVGPLGGLLTAVANVVTEQADERGWRSLPKTIAMARGNLPAGPQEVVLNIDGMDRHIKVDIQGEHQLVNLRMQGNHLYLVQPNKIPPVPSAPAIQTAKNAIEAEGAQ